MTGGMLSRGTTSWAGPSRLGSVTWGMADCMITRGGLRYPVRFSVPRTGGWRARGAARGGFERRLAGDRGVRRSPARISSLRPSASK
jgi:hypothetical protein